jgi:hypothetical protein
VTKKINLAFPYKFRYTQRTHQFVALFLFGGVAQLVEHLLCKQGVIGSNPFTSTIDLKSPELTVPGFFRLRQRL